MAFAAKDEERVDPKRRVKRQPDVDVRDRSQEDDDRNPEEDRTRPETAARGPKSSSAGKHNEQQIGEQQQLYQLREDVIGDQQCQSKEHLVSLREDRIAEMRSENHTSLLDIDLGVRKMIHRRIECRRWIKREEDDRKGKSERDEQNDESFRLNRPELRRDFAEPQKPTPPDGTAEDKASSEESEQNRRPQQPEHPAEKDQIGDDSQSKRERESDPFERRMKDVGERRTTPEEVGEKGQRPEQ